MKTLRPTPLTLLILQQSETSRWQTGKKSAAFLKKPLTFIFLML